MADTRTDSDLVLAARGGDSQAFAAIYDRYADRVFGLCATVTRDRGVAEDATAETFLSAWNRLEQLREPAQLRAWLFAIARNRAIKLGTRAAKLVPTDTLADTMSVDDTTDTIDADDTAAELQQMVWDAAEGLNPPERAVLDLQVRQGLEESEIAQVMGITIDHTYVLTSRMRKGLEASMAALFIARKGRDDCSELQTVLANWDGTYSPLIRKRVNRHVEQCATCADKKSRVNPFAVLAGAPAFAAPFALRGRVLDEMQRISFRGDWKADRHGFPKASPGTVRRTAPMWWAAAAAVVLIIVGALGLVLGSDGPEATAEGAPTTTAATTTLAPDAPTTAPSTPAEPEVTPAPTVTAAPTTTPAVTPDDPTPPPPTPAPDPQAPTISSVRVTPSTISKQECVTSITTMSVRVAAQDNVAITGGTVTASIGGSVRGTYALSGGGTSWTATVGPFGAGTPSGSILLNVRVVDAAGNAATATGGGVLSATCR